MAKVKLNATVEQFSGHTGNAVFVASREGTVMRQRVAPSQPNTPSQLAARERLRKTARQFKAFTAAQKSAWKAYGEQSVHADHVTFKRTSSTAVNSYTRLATKFLQVSPNGTPPTSPPTTPYAGDKISVTAAAGTGKITFSSSTSNASGTTTELLIQKLSSAGCAAPMGAYKNAQFYVFTAKAGGDSTDVAVSTGVYSVAYRFVNIATGEDTGILVIGEITVALALASGKDKAA